MQVDSITAAGTHPVVHSPATLPLPSNGAASVNESPTRSDSLPPTPGQPVGPWPEAMQQTRTVLTAEMMRDELVNMGVEPTQNNVAVAQSLAKLSLPVTAQTMAEAHASLGFIRMHAGDAASGLTSLRRAIELNPGLAFAHNMLARTLASYERHAEALAAANTSVQLDPLSTLIRTGVGDAYYFAREYEKSVFHYRMSIELDPRFDGAHTDLARALEMLGRFDEARAAYDEGRSLSGGVAGPTFGLAHLEAASGNVAEARRLLAELTEARSKRVVSAWGIGAVHASLGDVDEAFAWLEIAMREGATGLLLLRVHPRLDPIRQDPRYWPLVKRVGLADTDATGN